MLGRVRLGQIMFNQLRIKGIVLTGFQPNDPGSAQVRLVCQVKRKIHKGCSRVYGSQFHSLEGLSTETQTLKYILSIKQGDPTCWIFDGDSRDWSELKRKTAFVLAHIWAPNTQFHLIYKVETKTRAESRSIAEPIQFSITHSKHCLYCRIIGLYIYK